MIKKAGLLFGFLAAVSSPAVANSVSPNSLFPTASDEKAGSSVGGFEMFGLSPSGIYNGEVQVAGKKCKLKGVGTETCAQLFASISDVRLSILLFVFNDGKLFGVYGTAPSSNFSRVAQAFEAKYGQAYKTETGVWRNRAGATFDNVTKTWAFSDGQLKLEALGNKIDEMKFVFASPDNAPEKEAPKVNF